LLHLHPSRGGERSTVAIEAALRRLKRRGRIASPRRGFYVLVPVEYREAGCPPVSWFIDDLMRFLKQPDYVGLLSAAAIHGAAHQQPMLFQVVTDRPSRPVRVGRVRIGGHRCGSDRRGGVGPAVDAIRAVPDFWLGEPKRKQAHGRVSMLYRFETTTKPVQQMRLKVEINTREHFTVFGHQSRRFAVDNPWFSGSADIGTYQIEELLGTKLRALYQRKKGRDIYDLWLALTSLHIDDQKVIDCFAQYLEQGDTCVSRAEFEANLSAKLDAPAFLDDIDPLLPTGAHYDVAAAGALVSERLIEKLHGEPWRGAGS
jgi:hypothetical protein